MTTPSQTVGPFYTIGLVDEDRPQNELVPEGIALDGQLFDGQGEPIPDGLIEAWDAAGRRWGRSGTDGDGPLLLSRSSGCGAPRAVRLRARPAAPPVDARLSRRRRQKTMCSLPSIRLGAER